jgi:solute carrier family 25 phosphate transporter 3
MNEDGIRDLAKEWVPTFYSYYMEIIFMCGFYEAFKVLYSELLGEENAYSRRTTVYITASAFPELFSVVVHSPIKVNR